MNMRLEPIHDEDLCEAERICCEQCHMPISEDDEDDFGICEACHEANREAAEKGIREGADEKGYEEAA